mgnify:CR=1 FL=1
MKEFRAEFIERVERTKSVFSFRFKPQETVDFIPGQFAQIIFDEANKANRNLNKYLSFSCRPQKEYIEFTKRISSSDFSKRLWSLKKGDSILGKGPMGHCALEQVGRKHAALIGGIGITPIISMLEHIAFKKLPTDIHILYSNTTDEDVPFYHEIEGWTKDYPNIKVVHMVFSCVSKDKECFTGIITKDFVLKQIPDYKERIFYIFGPPQMVCAMEDICREIGCSPENIKAENFTGY